MFITGNWEGFILCKTILMVNISKIYSSGSTPTSGPSLPLREYVELQVDYWTVIQKPESTDKGDKSSKKDSNKSSLKSSFKSVQVTRLPHGSAPQGDNQMIPFTLVTVMREKKQKSTWFFKSENFQDYSDVKTNNWVKLGHLKQTPDIRGVI